MLDEYGFLNRQDSSAEVNIAPLLDMVFILLIFFVITTNFSRQTGVDVQKPKAQAALYKGPKTIMIGITREGTIHMFGKQMDIDGLKRVLSLELTKRPDANVVIVGDQAAMLGRTVEIIDACALAGVQKISIAADKIR
jgi:biopolymer transport protein ExbD